jgi:hypothetical protein
MRNSHQDLPGRGLNAALQDRSGEWRSLARACPRTVHSGRRRREETLTSAGTTVFCPIWDKRLSASLRDSTARARALAEPMECACVQRTSRSTPGLDDQFARQDSPELLALGEQFLKAPAWTNEWLIQQSFRQGRWRQASKRSKLQRQSFVPYGTKVGRSSSGHGYGCMSQRRCAPIS